MADFGLAIEAVDDGLHSGGAVPGTQRLAEAARGAERRNLLVGDEHDHRGFQDVERRHVRTRNVQHRVAVLARREIEQRVQPPQVDGTRQDAVRAAE
jgi:hypothetical protein